MTGKVAEEVAAAAALRGFGADDEEVLKGKSHTEHVRMLVPVVDPVSPSVALEFAYESNKLLLCGKEVRVCCCLIKGP